MRIPMQFQTRRQNTNQGQDQYRVWCDRAVAASLAANVPDLAAAIAANETWTRRIVVSWKNGGSLQPMSIGAYQDQSGELSFTASKKTALFDFAADRHARGTETQLFDATYDLSGDGRSDKLELDLTL